jgi:hypothetical protein
VADKLQFPELLPLKAGKIILFKFNADGTLTKTAANASLNNGTVASIGRGRTFNTKELPDGNSQYPMGVYDIGVNDTIVVNMSSFQPAIYAMLTGEEVKENPSDTMTMVEKEITIPDEAPFTVELDPAYNGTGTILAVGTDSTPYTKTDSAPATGEFSVSGDTLTFNSADAGKGLLITYDYDASTVSTGLPETVKRPILHAIISTDYQDKDQLNTYRANIIIDRCKSEGELKPPDQKSDPDGWSFTLRVLKPRGGKRPVDTKYEKPST